MKSEDVRQTIWICVLVGTITATTVFADKYTGPVSAPVKQIGSNPSCRRISSLPDSVPWAAGAQSFVVRRMPVLPKSDSVLSTVTAFGFNPPYHPDDVYWSDQFDGVGINFNSFEAWVLCEYQGKLIVGGQFLAEGSALASNIVSWDGYSWLPLGEGTDNSIYAMAVYHDNLVVGGTFTNAGGVPANHIAMWDGSKWSSMGSDLNGYVYDITTYRDSLVVVGGFTMAGTDSARHVAVWDGVRFHGLNSHMNGSVTAAASFENRLIVGGDFTQAGDSICRHVAFWNDTVWGSLGGGTNGSINDLIVYDSQMIAGGYFDSAGESSARNIAIWDGSQWLNADAGMDNSVWKLCDWDGKLVATGLFDSAGAQLARRVAAWDGAQWNSLDTGIWGWPYACLSYRNELVVGGWLSAKELYAHKLAVWNGSAWRLPYHWGTDDRVLSLSVYQDKLIVGGEFSIAGTVVSPLVAGWDGDQWYSLTGNLMARAPSWGWVRKTAVVNGELIAAGVFDSLGPLKMANLAAWNGQSWKSLADSIDGRPLAIAEYGGKLVVGGDFAHINGTSARCLAEFDGTQWHELGGGIGADVGSWRGPAVLSLSVYDGRLIVGGTFDSAGGAPVKNIVAWDGSQWSALGDGLDGSTWENVWTTVIYNDQLIAGGRFNRSGDRQLPYLAAWDGQNWLPVGASIHKAGREGTSAVMSMCVFDGKLIVGGAFDSAGGAPAKNIAAWDGSTWSALGSGVDSACWEPQLTWGNVIAVEPFNGKLMVGGDFVLAGGKVSSYLAMWTKTTPSDVDDDVPPHILPGSFNLSQNFPNPFNPQTTINFALEKRSHVAIEIFNVLGRKVRSLVNDTRSAGRYSIDWDGRDDNNLMQSTGVYLYRMIVDGSSMTHKMLLLK